MIPSIDVREVTMFEEMIADEVRQEFYRNKNNKKRREHDDFDDDSSSSDYDDEIFE